MIRESAMTLPSTVGSICSVMEDDLVDNRSLTVTSGYRHCAIEAVRYLIEEEGLSPDDPLVVGLRQHLGLREQHLDAERILNEFVMAQNRLLVDDAEIDEDLDNDDDYDVREYYDDMQDNAEGYFEDDDDGDSKYLSGVLRNKQETGALVVQSLAHWASTYVIGTTSSPPNGLKRNESGAAVGGGLPSSLGEHVSYGSNPSQNSVCSSFDNDRPSASSPSPSI